MRISNGNIHTNNVFNAGDLAPRLIDELASLVDEVFVPLLSNPLNHEGWPLVVSQDILKQIHNLKSTVYEVGLKKFKITHSSLIKFCLRSLSICIVLKIWYIFMILPTVTGLRLKSFFLFINITNYLISN